MNSKEFFEQKFAEKISQDPAILADAGLRNQSVAVELEGDEGGYWLFRFDDAGHVSMSPGNGGASCTITMKDETFQGMMKGKVNVPFAVLTRKIKIKGEAALAAKLGMALQKVFLKS